MPAPIIAQLIDKVWDNIEKAVTMGLAMEGPNGVLHPALDTVTVVAEEDASKAEDWDRLPIPGGSSHVRVEQSGNVFDIMHHYGLSYHELHSPKTDDIAAWAMTARQFELNLALQQYARAASQRSYTVEKLYQADPDGWGQRRCVAFRSGGAIPDTWERADLERVVRVDTDSANGVQGLVFRIAGGPYVRRPAKLSLSWTPAAHCTAELLLTEQLEFMKVQASTVIGIQMAPSAP
jgi:hypothetical protein